MNSKIIFSIIFFQFITTANAQVKQDSTDTFAFNDTTTHKEFREILSLQFSNIVTGNTFSNIGNYATIKTTDETLSFSLSILNNNGNVTSFKAYGGATEGVSSFFSNGDLNTNISGELTYHILINPLSNNTIKRNSFERDKLRDELQKAQDIFTADSIAISHKKELLDLKVKIDEGKVLKDGIMDSLKSICKRIKENPSEELKLKKDSLLYQKDKAEFDISLLYRQKRKIESDGYFDDAQEKAQQKFDKTILENNKKVINQAIEGISLFWISFGYGFRKDGFKLFDSSLDFTNQIQKEEALTHQFNIALSHYNWDSFSKNDTYWSVGISYKLGNNLSSLDNFKVRDLEEVSSNPIRVSFSEQSVFVGDFKDNLNELEFFFDYYKFFKTSSTNSFALHLYPTVLKIENTKPSASLWTGIVLPFKKTDDSPSYLNLEIFYSFNDLFNTSDSDDSLISRNTIGFSATFPISFF